MTDIVAFAGRLGAGKSAIADRVAHEFGAPRGSFGTVVRDRAVALGMPTDRETLQNLGDEMIATQRWDEFCRMVIRDETEMVVVDGVRHLGAVDGLGRLTGAGRFAVVFVDAPEQIRRTRVAKRDGTSDAEFAAAEGHLNERELPLVRQVASLIITNDSEDVIDLAPIVERLVGELRRLGFSRRKR